MRHRRPEQREDAVASGLHDVAIVAAHRLDHQLQRRVDNRAHLLGVEFFHQLGRALDIRKQGGDGLALPFWHLVCFERSTFGRSSESRGDCDASLETALNGVPHSAQNLEPGGLSNPHFAQMLLNAAPHSTQNLAEAGFSDLQLGHCIRSPTKAGRLFFNTKQCSCGGPAGFDPLPGDPEAAFRLKQRQRALKGIRLSGWEWRLKLANEARRMKPNRAINLDVDGESLQKEPAACLDRSFHDRCVAHRRAHLIHSFRPGFDGVARKFIDVDAPGLATQVLARLPYSRIRRPVFPLDDI
jgi:hypothetical protein